MDKIIEEDHVMLIITEITLDETILEKHKTTENKIIEVDTEGIIVKLFVMQILTFITKICF